MFIHIFQKKIKIKEVDKMSRIEIPVEETGLAGLLTPDEEVLSTSKCKVTYRINSEKLLNWTSPIILTNKGFAFVYLRKRGREQKKLYFTLDEITYSSSYSSSIKHEGNIISFEFFPGDIKYRELIVQRKREYLDYIRQHMDNKEIYKKKNEKRQLKQIAQMVKDIEKEKRRYAKRAAKLESKK